MLPPPERTGILAALGLGKQPALLAPRELAAPGDRNDLRVTARAFARGHLSSCPTGSFRGLGGRTRQSIQRRFHQRGHVGHVHVYLYSKLPETGVSPHIGTGGGEWVNHPRQTQVKGAKVVGIYKVTGNPWKPKVHGILMDALGIGLFGLGIFRLLVPSAP
jgi:hypothetical protein